jgi:hypothetical protein
MKASASGLIGAMLVGWVGIPHVAFPTPETATASRQSVSGNWSKGTTAQKDSTTCHSHSASCGCGRCTAARGE